MLLSSTKSQNLQIRSGIDQRLSRSQTVLQVAERIKIIAIAQVATTIVEVRAAPLLQRMVYSFCAPANWGARLITRLAAADLALQDPAAASA